MSNLQKILIILLLSSSFSYIIVYIEKKKIPNSRYKITTRQYKSHLVFYTNKYTENDRCVEFIDNEDKSIKICDYYTIENNKK